VRSSGNLPGSISKAASACRSRLASAGRQRRQAELPISALSTREPLGEPGDNGLPLIRLAFRFGLVAAQDVARRADPELLDKELGLAPRPLDEQRREGLFIVEHETANDGALRSRAPRMYSSLRLQRRDRRGRDHAAVDDDVHPADVKTLAQTVDDRQQHGGVAGVARHLGCKSAGLHCR